MSLASRARFPLSLSCSMFSSRCVLSLSILCHQTIGTTTTAAGAAGPAVAPAAPSASSCSGAPTRYPVLPLAPLICDITTDMVLSTPTSLFTGRSLRDTESAQQKDGLSSRNGCGLLVYLKMRYVLVLGVISLLKTRRSSERRSVIETGILTNCDPCETLPSGQLCGIP